MDCNIFSVSEVVVQKHVHFHWHHISYRFYIRNAAALQQEWTFTRDFYTNCEILSTSWRFEMTLHRNLSNGLVCGNATLKRNDSFNIFISAHFVITFRVMGRSCSYAPEHYVNAMQPFDAIHVQIPTIMTDEYSYYLTKEIMVDIKIGIRNCHLKGRRKRFASDFAWDGNERKKMHFSKM